MDDGENAQLEKQIHALVEKLELANEHEASKLIKQLQGRLDYTNYWYSNRLDRLARWAREEISEQQRGRFFSIVANGTASSDEPPTFAQQYNRMKWRMEKAESELAAIRKTQSRN